MAYLNFAEFANAAPAAGLTLAPPAPMRTDGFSPLEWSVVALAQRDSLSSLTEPGRIAIALGAIFGGERHNPRLADPRLEALRRLSVLAWHKSHQLPESEIAAFLQAGFTDDQFETLLASISRGRSLRKKRH